MKPKVIALIMLIAMIFTSVAYAKNDEAEDCEVKAIIVMHKVSGRIIKAQCEDEKLPVAGLVRLPMLLVIAEAIENGELKLSAEVTVTKAAADVKGPTAFIEANEVITVEELYKSAAMICAGDAIYALAEKLCGSEEAFCEKLNERLKKLGLDCTYSGLTGEQILLSAKDVAKISAELSKCESYLKYSSIYMDSITHSNGKDTELVNQNRLIRNMQGCKGLATGSSGDSMYCGSFYVERNSCEYICVVLGAKNSADRFTAAQSAIEEAFASYKDNKIASKGEIILKDYPISGATQKKCNIVALYDLSVLTEQSSGKLTCTYDLPRYITAPAKAGDVVGNATYSDAEGKVVCSLELTVEKDIDRALFSDFFFMVLCAWFD